MSDTNVDAARMLTDSAAAVVPRDGSLTRIRALRFTPNGFDKSVWRQINELGWTAILVPEDRGGAGLGMREAVALLSAMGPGLVPEPLVSGVLVAQLCDDETLARMLAGAYVAPAWQDRANSLSPGAMEIGSDVLNGTRRFVPASRAADSFLILAKSAVAVVPADSDGLDLTCEDTQDGGHVGTLRLRNVNAAVTPHTREDIVHALDIAALLTAAYLVGLAERAFELTLDYLKTRHQFGKPIGSFQALQHRAADLKLQLMLARASVEGVAAKFDGVPAEARSAAVSRARIRANRTALLVTKQGVQMHGAIGYTDEGDIGLFLRKTMALLPSFGSTLAHERRFKGHVDRELISAGSLE